MTCPVCCGDTQVTYTYDKNDHVVRDRKCCECGYKFKTIELDEDFRNDESKLKNLVADVRKVAITLSNLGDKYD